MLLFQSTITAIPVRLKSQPLTRRLLGHYMMFGLASIVVLSGVWYLVGHFLFHSGQERDLIARIDEVRTLIAADQSKNNGVGTQTLINLLGTEHWVAYAAVLGPDGVYKAHSKPSLIGRSTDAYFVHTAKANVIERQLTLDHGVQRREYWAPLVSDQTNIGFLQIGLVDVASLGWLSHIDDWLAYAFLAPILILGMGAFALHSAAKTNNAIEKQLCAVSASSPTGDLRLMPLCEPGPAAVGWNRLIERAVGQRSRSQLDSKLSQSINGLQEKRLERILNSLADGIAVTDAELKIVYANKAFAALLKPSEDANKLRGTAIQGLLPASASSHFERVQGSRPLVFEVQLKDTKDQGVLRVARSPLVGDDPNAAPQYVWTIRDVTQQKLADEMRTQFVHSATHELRTPLANIIAYAETLTINEISDPEQQKSFLNTINSEATRLARFVEELLNVSQMEAGSLSLAKTEVDLERMLGEIADKVRPQMVQKEITFNIVLPPKLPKIHLDKDKFLAALVNLLGNAAKYTPEQGCVTFKVVAGAKDLQIIVEDTGIGISADELPKLCTKFFRSSDARVRDIPGSGLGLSFTQEVARLHGGKLVVHSELNKGSQFSITLPIG